MLYPQTPQVLQMYQSELIPLDANTTASNNTAVGYHALGANTTGTDNTALGSQSLEANTTGASNSAFGRYALLNNTTASNNTAVGRSSLARNTTGANNTGVGYRALYVNTTASNNTAVGMQLFRRKHHRLLVITCSSRSVTAFHLQIHYRLQLEHVQLGTMLVLRLNTTASNNTAVGYTALSKHHRR
jgi:trimeric autotransporter adhesin